MKEAMKERMSQLYWLQKQLTYRLPDLANHTHSPRVKTILAARTLNAREQVSRLEKVFYLLDSRVEGKPTHDLETILEKFTLDIQVNRAIHSEHAVFLAGKNLIDYKLETYSYLISVTKSFGFQQIHRIFNGALKAEKKYTPPVLKIHRLTRIKKNMLPAI